MTDFPGLYDLKMPLPVWMKKYGEMDREQKQVTKILWVIKTAVRPDE